MLLLKKCNYYVTKQDEIGTGLIILILKKVKSNYRENKNEDKNIHSFCLGIYKISIVFCMNYKCVTKVMFNTSFDLENISFLIFPCSHFFFYALHSKTRQFPFELLLTRVCDKEAKDY